MDVDYTEEYGETALLLAAKAGKFDIAILLIRAGADVNFAKRIVLLTALHFAALSESPDIVEALIASGANVEQRDLFGGTALHLAARAGNVRIMSLLISNSADLETSDESGKTPLHLATLHGKDDAVRLLCRKGANINAAADNGKTALHFAVTVVDCLHIVKGLVLAGASLTACDDHRKTPLSLARSDDVKDFLESHGARE